MSLVAVTRMIFPDLDFRPQVVERLSGWTPRQFFAVATGEFLETSRRMAIPLAEGRTRCDVFHPLVNMGVLFAHSTWPKAVDEDTTARSFLAMVVDAVNLDPEGLLFSVRRSAVAARRIREFAGLARDPWRHRESRGEAVESLRDGAWTMLRVGRLRPWISAAERHDDRHRRDCAEPVLRCRPDRRARPYCGAEAAGSRPLRQWSDLAGRNGL